MHRRSFDAGGNRRIKRRCTRLHTERNETPKCIHGCMVLWLLRSGKTLTEVQRWVDCHQAGGLSAMLSPRRGRQRSQAASQRGGAVSRLLLREPEATYRALPRSPHSDEDSTIARGRSTGCWDGLDATQVTRPAHAKGRPPGEGFLEEGAPSKPSAAHA